MTIWKSTKRVVALSCLVVGMSGWAMADDDDDDYTHDEDATAFVHGAPSNPSDAWILAAGGRIYDNWMEALDRDHPDDTHPAYPAAGKQDGDTTWRCKECHGWDYRGVAGIYRKGSHFTGIKGIDGAIGMDEAKIGALLRATPHGYSADMINDTELTWIAAFVSRGQIDMSKYVDLETRAIIPGDMDHGRAVFQTTCAACHGFDGRVLDWGSDDSPAYVGTEAAAAPDEVMNKILNAHPGADMINLRAFGEEVAGDVLTYIATLPQD